VDRSEAWFRSLDAMRCSFLRNWLSDRTAILGESLIVNYFVSFYTSESVSLEVHGSVRPTPCTFHVTFIRIINVDKNNKRVYLKFWLTLQTFIISMTNCTVLPSILYF